MKTNQKFAAFSLLVVMAFAMLMVACGSESSSAPLQKLPELSKGEISLDGFTVKSIDNDARQIVVTPSKASQDTIKLNCISTILEAAGGSFAYLATTTDKNDPDIVNWDAELKDGSKVFMGDSHAIAIVVLDEKNRVIDVWEIVEPQKDEVSSSSEKSDDLAHSSESKMNTPTSAEEESSSSEQALSSSEKAMSTETVEEMSSSGLESSSSMESSTSEVSSSSEEAPLGVRLSDFGVTTAGSTVTVTGTKVYVEVPYGTDLTEMTVLPMDTVANLLQSVEMDFVDASGTLQTYSVVAGMQLPGSDFNARVDSIWATTSDAMSVSATEAAITISGSKNVDVSNSRVTITSSVVDGALGALGGSKKLAGGFYYTGNYAGDNALDIYEQGYTSGTPSTDVSDISLDMNFGKPFTARPQSFLVKYEYKHVANKDEDYPQIGLIYVLLLASDNKVIASGSVEMTANENGEKVVDLVYGNDSNLKSSGYVGTGDLSSVDGTGEVAYIRVMFASSAHAHNVAGGTTWFNDPSDEYRGGEGSTLTIKQFRLNY